MRRHIALLSAAALLLALLAGCTTPGTIETDPALAPKPTAPAIEPAPTDAPAPAETDEPVIEIDPDLVGKRLLNGGERDYAPDGYVDMVNFSDMAYERPDTQALIDEFKALADMAEAGEDADAILERYYTTYDAYLNFITMDTLAYIRYTFNTNDSFYKEEYDLLEQASPDISEALEIFNKACVDSPSRAALERDYFGYGYFDDYEDFSLYTNPDYLALSKQEEALMSEYRSALEDPQVEFHGETRSFWELMEEYEDAPYPEYLALLRSYYEPYNERVGKIFVELVRVRQQLAEVLGYESYADYSFEMIYGRDYSHEEGARFLDGIREQLVPISAELIDYYDYAAQNKLSISRADLVKGLQAAVQNIGGRVEEAFNFMLAYDLYDISVADEKFASSFTTYLYNYEAPFLTIDATGQDDDYVTFSHEFGHFVDAYVNYNAVSDLETAETYSQAMEFLSLCYTEGVLTERQREQMLQRNLLDTLDTFIYQAALAEFEDRVYAMDPDELTLDAVNDAYRQACKDYGIYASYVDFYYSKGWIDVTHLFEAPYYVISYCVSADTALQVYIAETEQTGAGLALYDRLLDRDPEDGVQGVAESAGLDNPFREGAVEEIAEFYRDRFKLTN